MGRCHSKVIYEKCVFLQIFETITGKKYKKIYFQFCIDYESHKCMLKIFFFFFQTSSCLSYHLQLEVYYVLLHSKLKKKFYTHWNPNWFKKYMPNCLSYLTVNLFLSVLFHIFQLKKWIIPDSFRNGKISYSTLALNFKDWIFSIIATLCLRPKSGHLNDRVYCKPIDRAKKMLFNKRSGSFLRQIIPE